MHQETKRDIKTHCMVKDDFILGLHQKSISQIQKIPKGDLHNHVARGGNIRDYRRQFLIPSYSRPTQFDGYEGMEKWYKENIRCFFDCSAYIYRIIFALQQLVRDGVTVCILTYGDQELGLFASINDFVEIQKALYIKYAPNVKIIPEFGLNSLSDIQKLDIDRILKLDFFESIDIHGKEMINPADYRRIFFRAYSNGLRLRAHIGEVGGPEKIKQALDVLELNEINHGNRAAEDLDLMRYICKKNVRVNMCPESNIALGLYKDLKTHPIRAFYDFGISVTVNTDDMLIFDKSVSVTFLDLYNSDIFSASELDDIRTNSLRV